MDPSNWQTELSTIRERTEYAFNNSLFCDVEFSVVDSNGVKVAIPANKYILAVSSPVFEAMFYGHLAESKPTIELPDCTKAGLQEMLRYVSTHEVKLTGDNVVEVVYLADKYMMPFLKEKCKHYIGPEDVLKVLPVVDTMSDDNLKDHLWKIVDCETNEVITSKSFLNVSREMLCKIVGRDTLDISELSLFCAVDRWVRTRIEEQGLESNGETKRSILGEEVIRLIRFPLMTEKQFADVVLPFEVLEKNELTELVQNFNHISPETNMFNGKKRYVKTLLIPKIRFRSICTPNQWKYSQGKIDALAFTVNKTSYLIGMRLFGSHGSKYRGRLTMYKNKEIVSQKTIHDAESEMFDNAYYGFTVKLDKPIRVVPGAMYTVEVLLAGPPSYYGERGRHIIPGDNLMITYEYTTKSRNGTTPHEGQFPTMIFRKM